MDAALPSSHRKGATRHRSTVFTSIAFFLTACLVFFLGMHRYPNIYDESIVLTAAMRILAGQVPHRDFYAIYGPAGFYSYAALFRIFGTSLLVERLWSIAIDAFTVTAVFTIASLHVRRSIAIAAGLVAMAWLYGLDMMTIPYAATPAALCGTLAAVCLAPWYAQLLSRRRLFAAGALAGLCLLYRYDTGIAVFGLQLGFLLLASWHRSSSVLATVRLWLEAAWMYAAGFAVLVLPPLAYYLSVAHFHDFVHDIFLFPSQHYHAARNLPFPGIHLQTLDALGIYLPIVIVFVSIFIVATNWSKSGSNAPVSSQTQGLLLSLGMLAFVMYFKGVVRVSNIGMYLSFLPSLLLLALLLQHRDALTRNLRLLLYAHTFCVLLASVGVVRAEIVSQRGQRGVVGRLLRVTLFRHRAAPGIQSTWCQEDNPLTRGFCFLPDEPRIDAIDFIRGHTRPDQPLYVGLMHHDTIFANDNLIYFATQRLPATHWSHFDPDLQNTAPIQQQMIQEFESGRPPYIVLDSEFSDGSHEANDSARSSGVTLLDIYIRAHYRLIQSFDPFQIWQRTP